MEFLPVDGISGLLVIQPDIYYDDRGLFLESYHADRFSKAGLPDVFTQDNHSVSDLHVIRGLHFQAPPYEQGKLVRVVNGSALDVAVDIRKHSPSYGQSFSILLDARKHQLLWIPPGFAHGFAALEPQTVFLYKCTKPYNKDSESGIAYNDPDLEIDWKVSQPVVSLKDRDLGLFRNLVSPF
jgi:dTDP-4-dehydrorhamnose 3,5-epimerase